MWDVFSALLIAAVVNNVVLVQFLGLCPLLGSSRRLETAVPMSLATMFVMTVATIMTYSLYHLVLQPFELGYLRIVVFIVAIASVVQFIELYIRHTSKLLHQLLGIYLPLITSNCAVMGVALTVIDLSLGSAIAFVVGASLGFSIVMVLFASQRDRLERSSVPAHMRGAPIAFITAGVMALAFSGFHGIA